MIYQLVLITNLGIMTPLVNFPTWEECLRERAKISKTQQYSAECLPAQSPEQMQKQIESSMKMMLDTLNKLSQSQKQ
jgi:hypothetical protein